MQIFESSISQTIELKLYISNVKLIQRYIYKEVKEKFFDNLSKKFGGFLKFCRKYSITEGLREGGRALEGTPVRTVSRDAMAERQRH